MKPADQQSDEFAEMGSAVRTRFMDYETKVNCAIQDSRMMAVSTYLARAAALHREQTNGCFSKCAARSLEDHSSQVTT